MCMSEYLSWDYSFNDDSFCVIYLLFFCYILIIIWTFIALYFHNRRCLMLCVYMRKSERKMGIELVIYVYSSISSHVPRVKVYLFLSFVYFTMPRMQIQKFIGFHIVRTSSIVREYPFIDSLSLSLTDNRNIIVNDDVRKNYEWCKHLFGLSLLYIFLY